MPDVTRATQQYLENTPNKLYLYVGIQDAIDGRKIQRLTPDKDGYFNGLPLSAFNSKSLNGCYYNTESYYRHLTDPSSVFNIKLTNGNLYGEWGHPKDETNLARVCKIDRDQESHHFKAVYTEKNGSSSNPIILGDLKPTGPKGQYLEASLLNPHENTAFSLRCLMTEAYDSALRAPVRTVEEFITYDAVDMPGIREASRRYASPTQHGCEFLMPITLEMLYSPSGKRVALEGYSDTRILELFGISDFDLNGKSLGAYIKGTNTYKDHHGVNHSLTHAAITEGMF